MATQLVVPPAQQITAVTAAIDLPSGRYLAGP